MKKKRGGKGSRRGNHSPCLGSAEADEKCCLLVPRDRRGNEKKKSPSTHTKGGGGQRPGSPRTATLAKNGLGAGGPRPAAVPQNSQPVQQSAPHPHDVMRGAQSRKKKTEPKEKKKQAGRSIFLRMIKGGAERAKHHYHRRQGNMVTCKKKKTRGGGPITACRRHSATPGCGPT